MYSLVVVLFSGSMVVTDLHATRAQCEARVRIANRATNTKAAKCFPASKGARYGTQCATDPNGKISCKIISITESKP